MLSMLPFAAYDKKSSTRIYNTFVLILSSRKNSYICFKYTFQIIFRSISYLSGKVQLLGVKKGKEKKQKEEFLVF